MLVFVIIPFSIVAGVSTGFGVIFICWAATESVAVIGMAIMPKTISPMRILNMVNFLTVIDSSETHSDGKVFIIYFDLSF
jgi:hypothetical protein